MAVFESELRMNKVPAAVAALAVAISPEQGARTSVYLASGPELTTATGGYYSKSKLAKPSKAARSDASAARLWDESVTLVANAPE